MFYGDVDQLPCSLLMWVVHAPEGGNLSVLYKTSCGLCFIILLIITNNVYGAVFLSEPLQLNGKCQVPAIKPSILTITI